MARFQRTNHKQQQKRSQRTSSPRAEPTPYQVKPTVVFGDAFIVMEDGEKNTFVYNGGTWVPYAMSIAECRVSCQVKVLQQKVNNKTRYEIREPLP